ncbi:tetratricopeptide repeat protein [Saccharicrinis fermentans]|uniref:Putative Zn-dependent protease n=1 Tax=Saccharicrinis fermentans DSM 9555 = JCM 21142 TaxID=869213 RepID=W7YR15_9BACT|nr:tetratricopeptide repeat protein [Saccharicrinis fermentans]GAF04869.1 putative Zn-dependent protease [Saccharicrinis fermentans DSM 9555 = JCM 21142]
MSNKEKEYATETSMENVEHALSKTEQFIEDNQKVLTIIMFAVIIVIGGYWGAKKLYFAPQEQQAQTEMFQAQNYFEKDSFNLALNGDGMNLGFLEIADDYGMTKPGNLAKYYAGVSYLHLGQFDDAIEYLSSFSCDDELLDATAKGALADAYLEKGNIDEAISNYKKATEVDNSIVAPAYLLKLGLIYEEQKEYNKAIEVYQRIKDDFKSSLEARSIDKYITRAQISASK